MSIVKPQSRLQKTYIKDVSFETPNGLKALGKEWKPNLHLDLNTGVKRIEDKLFEVVLSLTVIVKNNEQSAYLVEVQQAGLFSVNIEDDTILKMVLASECPALLFPYAREVVSSLVGHGGFPPLVLAPMDFDALYQQAIDERDAANVVQH